MKIHILFELKKHKSEIIAYYCQYTIIMLLHSGNAKGKQGLILTALLLDHYKVSAKSCRCWSCSNASLRTQ